MIISIHVVKKLWCDRFELWTLFLKQNETLESYATTSQFTTARFCFFRTYTNPIYSLCDFLILRPRSFASDPNHCIELPVANTPHESLQPKTPEAFGSPL